MRCSEILGLAVFALWTAPVAAECFVCAEVVELTDEYADCFIAKFDPLIEALEHTPAARQQVDLADCEPVKRRARRRDGLVEMGVLPPVFEADPKSVYIFDRPRALCLRDLIQAHEGAFNPAVAFDLIEACNGL